MNNFPVIKTVKNSFVFVFENWRHALKVTWPYALFLLITTLIFSFFFGTNEDEWTTGVTIASIIYIPITFVIYFSLAISWHRAYVIGPSRAHPVNVLRLTRHEWRFMGLSILLFIALGVVFIAAVAPVIMFMVLSEKYVGTAVALTIVVIPFVALAFFLYTIYTRLLLCLPAAALGSPISFKESFRLSKGIGMRLALTNLIVLIPYIFLNAKGFSDGFRDGYEAEKIENEQERLQASGAVVSTAETPEVTSTPELSFTTEDLVDFLLSIPMDIIVPIFFTFVWVSNLSQCYKWVMENRR